MADLGHWRLDNPLYSLTDDEQNQKAKDIWEGESLGGIKENNAPLPRPVIGLLVLTILTAFAITFPLWGQRPTAAIYADYVPLLKSVDVQQILNDPTLSPAVANDKAMKLIVNTLKQYDSKYAFQRDQHPITMDQLRIIAPQIVELQSKGVDLEEYEVIGDKVYLQNFFGNTKPDGSIERKQPWWDKGYTIDVFYIIYFCIAVMIAVKRLPHFSWKPDHSKAH